MARNEDGLLGLALSSVVSWQQSCGWLRSFSTHLIDRHGVRCCGCCWWKQREKSPCLVSVYHRRLIMAAQAEHASVAWMIGNEQKTCLALDGEAWERQVLVVIFVGRWSFQGKRRSLCLGVRRQ